MESSYATSIELQNSVAVGTTERGLSYPSFYLSCLGNVQLPRSGVEHIVSAVSVFCSVDCLLLLRKCKTPLWPPGFLVTNNLGARL